MAVTGKDEIGHLGTTLNTMVDGLRQLARQSREATENLNAAAAEIRASTQEQAASVEEQLAAVQETAATVDEITHSGTQIGKRAQEVIASAQAAAQTSISGLQAVEETARAMDSIREQAEAVAENIVALSEKTQAVGEIISSVNDISERTHLLALNAAIEAAAAGENGRSFAVVASEMKTLADQAKDATLQVRSILGDIQRGINSSVMLTEEAVKRVAAGKERTDIDAADHHRHLKPDSGERPDLPADHRLDQPAAARNRAGDGRTSEHPPGEPADGGRHASARYGSRQSVQPRTAASRPCRALSPLIRRR